jgi:ABC-type sulfate/molybdate transport systems ATPase subunit
VKKYLFAVAILAFVVLASGCIAQQGNQTSNQTKTYSAGGISFKYPGSWNIIAATTNNTTIVTVNDVNFNRTNATRGAAVMILKTPKTSNANAQQLRQQMLQRAQHTGANATVTTATTVNGISANETTYNEKNRAGRQEQVKIIDFEKNNNFYIIMLVPFGGDLQSQKQNFDLIVNSFKVQ